MTYIVIAMVAVFVFDFLQIVDAMSIFAFDRSAIMEGEVWRIITFIAIPPNALPIFIIFAFYLYWMIGQSLEGQWGALKFNIFYLCGIIGTIIAGLITGYSTNMYLNLSLFLAFAILFPDFQLRLFFILPIRIKWLGLVHVAFLTFSFVISSWPVRAAILASIINVILFCGMILVEMFKRTHRRAQWKKSIKR